MPDSLTDVFGGRVRRASRAAAIVLSTLFGQGMTASAAPPAMPASEGEPPGVGACWRRGGGCTEGLISADCYYVGGYYLGDDSQCSADSCSGACCMADQ